MILWLVGLGIAADLDRERAAVALASEEYVVARDLARDAIADDPGDLVAHRIYLEASEEAGWLRIAGDPYVAEGDPLHIALRSLHAIARDAPDRARHLRALDQRLASLPPQTAAVVSAQARLLDHEPEEALDALGDVGTDEALRLRLVALRETEGLRALSEQAWEIAQERPDRPDLLAPIGQVEERRLKRLRKRVLARIEQTWPEADLLALYQARTFAIAVGDYELSRTIGARLAELGEEEPLYRPPRARGTRRATASILARRGRAMILPGPPSEMEDFVRYLSEIFFENGETALGLEVWARFREIEDTGESALQHGTLLLDGGDAEAALEAAIRAVKLISRGSRVDPGGLDFAQQRPLLAAAWGLRAEAEHALGERRQAMRSAHVAWLLNPEPRWQALHARVIARLATTGGTHAPPAPEDREVIRTTIAQAQLMVEEDQREASVATATEASLLGSKLARDGRPVLDGEDLALLFDVLASGTTGEEALCWTTTALWLDPRGHRFARRGALLEELGDVDAAFVAFALGGDTDGISRTWTGIGPEEVAAAEVLEVWAAFDPSASKTVHFSGTEERRGERPRVGEKMPRWTVDTEAGPVGSATLQGQVVVLSFWASWCGPCMVELPALEKLARAAEAEGLPLTVVAVSVDSSEAAWRKASARLHLDRVANAWKPELKGRFRVRSLPQSFLIAPDGTVVRSHTGFSPGDEVELEQEIRDLLP